MFLFVMRGNWCSMDDGYLRVDHRLRMHGGGSSSSRGIIMCLHNCMVPMALSLVQELRTLGNTDAIHMYHCGADEMTPLSRTTVLAVDPSVQFIDVCTDMVGSGKLREDQVPSFRSYWLKPLALIHTSLDHVMLMDTDVMVFHDPALLWDVQGYKDTGTLFFRDREILIQMFLTDIIEFPDHSKKYVFNPHASHLAAILDMEGRRDKLLSNLPTHVSAQRRRSKALVRAHDPDNLWNDICLFNRGSEPIREQDVAAMRRKINSAVDIAIELEAAKKESKIITTPPAM
ncbi:hypothetical protein DYB30_001352 [Aphanomyces astaci]|uniref:Nucleotide-diphospho-sugar transferase domain-containing protein n=1 Tax=Aphanomyces astaci TaxID=112090 RepID=A0A397DHT5_APHAT|nr:hypothetical protein DYB30_001352 [Aphanomyces astaci]